MKRIKRLISLLLALAFISSWSFFIFPKQLNAQLKQIEITEIMYNPEGNDSEKEWIEFKNESVNSLKIADWKLIESSKPNTQHKISLYQGNSVIEPGEYFIIAENAEEFIKSIPKDCLVIVLNSNFSLSNTAEEIILLNANGNPLATTSYESSSGGKGNGFTLEWEDEIWRESYIKGGTPGKRNSQESDRPKYDTKIRLNEILPNPEGDEKTGEFIELYNFSSNEVNLENWILKDMSKTRKFVFPEGFFIKSDGYLAVYKNLFKFAMNNSGREEIFLLDPNGKIISSVSYKKSFEEVSYNFDSENNNWRWSKFLTPGEKNKFDKLPDIEIGIDKKIYKNSYADFNIKLKNYKEKEIKITWNFGDGKKSYKKKIRHKYKEVGIYQGSVKIFNGSEEVIKKFTIKVEKYPQRKARIIRLMPNPAGNDSKLEWIEIKNKSKKKINLKNWSIATGTSSKKLVNHPIYKDFIIQPGKSKIITREDCNFILGNKKTRIELRYPNGKIAYKVKYKKENGIDDNEIYEKIKDDGWKWTKIKNMTEINIIEPSKKSENKEDTLETEEIKESAPEEDPTIATEKFLNGQPIAKEDSRQKNFFAPLNYGLRANPALTKNYPEKLVLGAETKRYNKETLFFSPSPQKRDHYLVSFLKNIARNLNGILNNFINMVK